MHLSSLVVWSAIMSSTASNFGGVGDTNGGIATGHGIQGLPIAPARGVLGDAARPHGVLATEYGVGTTLQPTLMEMCMLERFCQ